MKISSAGVKHIKLFEGERLTAYRCPAGVWTIGVGHTSAAGEPTVVEGMKITANESAAILYRDLVEFEIGVDRLVTVPLKQNQFDVLVSFAFNCGLGALAKSTLLKKLNSGNYDSVPAELMKWTRAGGSEVSGLVRRRRAEAKMWRGLDTSQNVDGGDARLKPDLPKPSKSILQSKEASGAIAAGAGSALAAAQEVIPVIRDGGEILSSINATVIICISIIMIAAAIWYWRKQRLDEEGA